MSYIGWKLPESERERLLDIFPATYVDVIAHHVTLRMGDGALPEPVEAAVVGIVDDGKGVQALVVTIDGTYRRPDGKIYHITWSIDRAAGRKPVHSNEVIAQGFKLFEPLPIRVEPFVSL